MGDHGKKTLHSTVLIDPVSHNRKQRKANQKAAAELRSADHAARKNEARAQIEAQHAEQRSVTYLPRGGAPGPHALRSARQFHVPAHQDTSATLAGAYPFLAEGGLGPEGVFIGQDLYSGGSFVYDPWVLYQ